MEELKGDRPFSIHYRTNKHVQWKYATYAGRWETEARAIEEVRNRLDGSHGQYLIENMATGKEAVGTL